MKKIRLLLLLLLTGGFSGIAAGESGFLGENLCDVIKFGSWKKYGSGTIQVVPDAYNGGEALRINEMPSGKSGVVVSPFIPVKEGYYNISMVYKSKGFGLKGYSGVSAWPTVVWYNAKKQVIQNKESLWRFEYFDMDWDTVDSLLYCPPDGAFICFRITLGNDTPFKGKTLDPEIMVADIQVRRYTPSALPDKVDDGTQYPVRTYCLSDKKLVRAGDVVEDKDAEKGRALSMPGDGKKILAVHGQYEKNWKPGVYRLQARVKRAESDKTQELGCIDILSQNDAGRLVMNLNTDNVKPADKYVVLERDFIIHSPGYNVVRLLSYGQLPWSVDWIKISPVISLSGEQIEKIYSVRK